MNKKLKADLYQIIFEADTKGGKLFDVVLLLVISFSIVVVALESVASINAIFGKVFKIIEWTITAFFTIEYLTRIYIVHKPAKYIFSFYGLIDLCSVLPTYLGLIFAGTHGLIAIRAIRLLRVFRILKLTRYLSESSLIIHALQASRRKISVFLFAVTMIIVIIGTVMYLIEGSESGFTSIPQSIYWAIVTLTTVGYGDIAPATTLGKFFASFVMIIGYSIIAVPTGIVTSELTNQYKKDVTTHVCPECLSEGHDSDAKFCKFCGSLL